MDSLPNAPDDECSDLNDSQVDARNDPDAHRIGPGASAAMPQIAAPLYEELRAIARRELLGERLDHTLQPTALVHEAYLRIFSSDQARFENRAHFFAAATKAIRRVLVDHARKHASLKNGDGRAPDPLTDLPEPGGALLSQWIALDEAIERLARLSPFKSRIVELRFFAGMSTTEIARALGVSDTTIRREWRVTRAWLRSELVE